MIIIKIVDTVGDIHYINRACIATIRYDVEGKQYDILLTNSEVIYIRAGDNLDISDLLNKDLIIYNDYDQFYRG